MPYNNTDVFTKFTDLKMVDSEITSAVFLFVLIVSLIFTVFFACMR